MASCVVCGSVNQKNGDLRMFMDKIGKKIRNMEKKRKHVEKLKAGSVQTLDKDQSEALRHYDGLLQALASVKEIYNIGDELLSRSKQPVCKNSQKSEVKERTSNLTYFIQIQQMLAAVYNCFGHKKKGACVKTFTPQELILLCELYELLAGVHEERDQIARSIGEHATKLMEGSGEILGTTYQQLRTLCDRALNDESFQSMLDGLPQEVERRDVVQLSDTLEELSSGGNNYFEDTTHTNGNSTTTVPNVVDEGPAIVTSVTGSNSGIPVIDFSRLRKVETVSCSTLKVDAPEFHPQSSRISRVSRGSYSLVLPEDEEDRPYSPPFFDSEKSDSELVTSGRSSKEPLSNSWQSNDHSQILCNSALNGQPVSSFAEKLVAGCLPRRVTHFEPRESGPVEETADPDGSQEAGGWTTQSAKRNKPLTEQPSSSNEVTGSRGGGARYRGSRGRGKVGRGGHPRGRRTTYEK